MKIGIDARMIQHSGIGTYIQNLVERFPGPGAVEYVLFGSREKLARYNKRIVAADFSIYSLKEQFLLPGIIKKSACDLFHFTHYNVPLAYRGNYVVNIHDLIHLIFPGYLPSKAAYFYAKVMISNACRNATKILALSENTKNDIIKYLGTDPSKIAVINPGVSESFMPGPADPAIKALYGDFLLYVGNIRPHKNLIRLIDAFNELKKRSNLPHKLIIIGRGKPEYVSTVKKHIAASGRSADIVILSEVTDAEIRAYYKSAGLFVFPSLYEGFGLPPLEAMASGCPVVASNTSSLPEVVGEAGILVDPLDTFALSESLYRGVIDAALRKDLIEKGLERAKCFSWKKTAEETLAIYSKC